MFTKQSQTANGACVQYICPEKVVIVLVDFSQYISLWYSQCEEEIPEQDESFAAPNSKMDELERFFSQIYVLVSVCYVLPQENTTWASYIIAKPSVEAGLQLRISLGDVTIDMSR